MIRIGMLLAMMSMVALAQTNPTQSNPKPPTGGRGSRPAAAAAARNAATAAPLSSYKELKFPELRSVALPPITSVTLPNGLRLYLLEDHELPLIKGLVLVRTGTLFDPADKTALAALTGQMLLEGGTVNKPGEDVARRLEDMGAEISGSVAENTAAISISALKGNAGQVLDILKDILTAPAFQQDRLDFVKARMRNSVAHRNDDAEAILRREFNGAVYGKETPYGAQMEYATLDRINRVDLVNFYQRYFFPKNVILGLQGDFDPARMKAQIEALFGEWNAVQAPVPEFPKVDPNVAGTYLAVKKDTTQGFIAMGQTGGTLLDQDYAAMQIATDILGGSARGRIAQRLGNTASSVSAQWAAAYGYPGLFQINCVITPFRTTQVIQVIRQELVRIATQEVTEEELKTAKDTALNSLVFSFSSPMAALGQVMTYDYFSYPPDYIERRQKALASVTRADVLRAAKARLDPDKMTVVVVGNPTAFAQPLEALGKAVTPLDLTIPPPKLEATFGDAASIRRGKQMLSRAQQAMGGTDKLAALKDWVREIGYQPDQAAGSPQGAMTERWIGPDYLRVDNSMANAKVSVYTDGKTGWVASGQNSTALAGVQLKQIQGELFRALVPLLLSDHVPGRKINALDDNTVEVSAGPGEIVKLVFDPATGLLKSMLYDALTDTGQMSVLETYTDYREVAGLKFPFQLAITLAGQKFQTQTTKSLQLNTGLKIQDLEKRP